VNEDKQNAFRPISICIAGKGFDSDGEGKDGTNLQLTSCFFCCGKGAFCAVGVCDAMDGPGVTVVYLR
jgi:hypothetical protein